MVVSKISIPLKNLKKSSIDLADKYFDSNISGGWKGNLDKENVFLNTYIQEKFDGKLHIVPFVSFFVIYDYKVKKALFTIDDSRNSEKFVNQNNFDSYYEKFKNTKKRFTYYSITTKEINGGNEDDAHAVSCLYDTKTNTVEFFDILGDHLPEYKKLLKYIFVEIYGGKVKIIYFVKRCVEFSQLSFYNCPKEHYKYNSDGFCVIWTLWFLDIRLSNPDVSTREVVEKALIRLRGGDKICKLIRGYAQFVDKIFSKFSIVKTSSSFVIKFKESKKSSAKEISEFKRDYKYLYVILASLLGSLAASVFINNLKKK